MLSPLRFRTDGSAGNERGRCRRDGDIFILDGLDRVVSDEEATRGIDAENVEILLLRTNGRIRRTHFVCAIVGL